MRALAAVTTLLIVAAAPARAEQAAANPASPCKTIERETIVCDTSKQILRVIHESTSPSGRYAVAWTTIDPKGMQNLEKDSQSTADKIMFHSNDYERVRTYLVRLSDGKIMKPLESKHFGDNDSYNHRDHRSIWSSDEHYLIENTNLKWFSEVVSAYYIGPREEVIGPFRLTAPARQAAATLFKTFKEKRFAATAPATFDIQGIDNDGLMKAKVGFSEPKQDEGAFDVEMTMRLKPVAMTLTSELKAIKLTKD